MLQAIARSPSVYDTHRPETPSRNRRNGPKPPTYRNRGAQPKAWKPSELRGVITEYKRDQENRRRAVQARELETNLQTQGVDRNEWPAIIEAAGFSPVPARQLPPIVPQNPARRPAGANAYNMPGSYGDFAEAAGFGATNLHEQPDESQDDIKVEHVLQGLWKVDDGAWVVEGECPVSWHCGHPRKWLEGTRLMWSRPVGTPCPADSPLPSWEWAVSHHCLSA